MRSDPPCKKAPCLFPHSSRPGNKQPRAPGREPAEPPCHCKQQRWHSERVCRGREPIPYLRQQSRHPPTPEPAISRPTEGFQSGRFPSNSPSTPAQKNSSSHSRTREPSGRAACHRNSTASPGRKRFPICKGPRMRRHPRAAQRPSASHGYPSQARGCSDSCCAWQSPPPPRRRREAESQNSTARPRSRHRPPAPA